MSQSVFKYIVLVMLSVDFFNGCGYIEPETMALNGDKKMKVTVLEKEVEPVKSPLIDRNNVALLSQPCSHRTIAPWAPVWHIKLTCWNDKHSHVLIKI